MFRDVAQTRALIHGSRHPDTLKSRGDLIACYKDELDLTNKDTSLYSENHGARKRYKIDLRTAVLVESISIFEPTAEYITISGETLVESMGKKAYDF